jgi:hypothetical protein
MSLPVMGLIGLMAIAAGKNKNKNKENEQNTIPTNMSPRDTLIQNRDRIRTYNLPTDERSTNQILRNEYVNARISDSRPQYKLANYSIDRRAQQNIVKDKGRREGVPSLYQKVEKRFTQRDLHQDRKRQLMYASTTKKLRNKENFETNLTKNEQKIPRYDDFADNPLKQRNNSDIAFAGGEPQRSKFNYVTTGLLRALPYQPATQRALQPDSLMNLGTLDPNYKKNDKVSTVTFPRRTKNSVRTIRNPLNFLSNLESREMNPLIPQCVIQGRDCSTNDNDIHPSRKLNPIPGRFKNRNLSRVLMNKQILSTGKSQEYFRPLRGTHSTGTRMRQIVTEVETNRDGAGASGTWNDGTPKVVALRKTRGRKTLNKIGALGEITNFPNRENVPLRKQSVTRYPLGLKQTWHESNLGEEIIPVSETPRQIGRAEAIMFQKRRDGIIPLRSGWNASKPTSIDAEYKNIEANAVY